MKDANLIDYYSHRANEYEQIYAKPERQNDLHRIRSFIRKSLLNHSVLEIACGTGYWTKIISDVADSVVATDASLQVLEIARKKEYRKHNVKFIHQRVEQLDSIKADFSAAFAGFWFSHILKQDRVYFIEMFHQRLGNGSKAIFVDNRYIEGSSTPIAYRDEFGNTYQDRILSDGSQYRVLKNFPEINELRAIFESRSTNLVIKKLSYYWLVYYEIKLKSYSHSNFEWERT